MEGEEERQATRYGATKLRPFVKIVGCGLPILILLTCAASWKWALLLTAASIVFVAALGAWSMTGGPGSPTRRSIYRTTLQLAGVTREAPKLAVAATSPMNAYITWMGGNRRFIKLSKRGLAAQPELVHLMGSTLPFDRWRAAISLGYVGDYDAVPALVNGLADSDSPVKRACVASLELIGSDAATSAVRAFYETTDDDASWLEAAAVLGEDDLDPARLVRAVNLLKHMDPNSEEDLGQLLGRLPLSLASDLLTDHLGSAPHEVLQALFAVARRGDPEAADFIRTYLRSDDPAQVRGAVLACTKASFPELVPDLERLTTHADGQVAHSAKTALTLQKSEKLKSGT